MKKTDNFLKAIKRLQEAMAEYTANTQNTVIRDGLIQRFEFTFELSWKALKEYMIDQGIKNEMQFPKQVLKTAYENRIINDEKVWLDMLEARNSTSHIYDDKAAERIGKNICDSYVTALAQLEEYFENAFK